MDLKIELRSLFALHEASIHLRHGIRGSKRVEWVEFAPTNFVYAFFTFNSIYSFDWTKSFMEKKAMQWEPNGDGKFPQEIKQIKSYVEFVDKKLGNEAPKILSEKVNETLASHSINNADKIMEGIKVSNSDRKSNNIAKQMPTYVKKLTKGMLAQQDFYATLVPMLNFVYKVRCNIFHGVKTHVAMTKPDQQQRLLVWYALLVGSNQLLFEIAKSEDIGWITPTVNFSNRSEYGVMQLACLTKGRTR